MDWVRIINQYYLQLKFAIDQGQEYFNMSGGNNKEILEVSKLQ